MPTLVCREAKNERLKAKNWLPSAIFLVLFGRNLLTVQKAVIHAANTAVLKSYPQQNRRNGGICLEYMLDETVTTAGISSYSGLERLDSSPGPSIFRGIFRNTKFWRTLYIPKEIPEYLA